MKKIILALAFTFSIAMNAQQITTMSNTVDQSFSTFITNSPTNTYGNRRDIIWLKSGEWHMRIPSLYYDTLGTKSYTLTSNPKMFWIDVNTNQAKVTSMTSMLFPWSTITGAPAFLTSETDPTVASYIKSISSGDITTWNTVINKFNIPSGTISQYVRGDGSLAILPSYNAGTGLSLVGGTFNNIMPDQTVSITGTGGASVTGTYPNFTVNTTANTASTTVITGSTGISVLGTAPNYTVINISPNITPTITGVGSTTVISSGNTFTINTPAVATRTMATPARSIVTSTASSGFTISATSDYNVNYSIYAQVSSALVGINTADVYLEISPNNSTWTTISRSGISIQGVLSTSGNTQTVSGFVPASYYVRIRTAATGANSGSAVFTYQNGQENSY